MITGQNPRLSYLILAENFHRLGPAGIGLRPPIDAAYCLDAPEVLAAGSTERYQSDPSDNSDWHDMPTMVYRVPNAQAQLPAVGGSGAAQC